MRVHACVIVGAWRARTPVPSAISGMVAAKVLAPYQVRTPVHEHTSVRARERFWALGRGPAGVRLAGVQAHRISKNLLGGLFHAVPPQGTLWDERSHDSISSLVWIRA